jgi:hypothetical protein
MIDARISGTLSGEGRSLADDIVARLVRIGQGCRGTLILGSGDPMILRGGAASPHVIAPLTWYQRPNPIGRSQLAHADAVVLIHEDELDLITAKIAGDPLLVIATHGESAGGSFLQTTNPYEVVAAAGAVAGHPALEDALPGMPARAMAWHALVDLAAEAMLEAFVATDGVSSSSAPGPQGRR